MKKISLTQYANTMKVKSSKHDNKFYIESIISKISNKRIAS
ncbi:hypothetical protein ACFX5K_03610 [Rickettsiales bacterium LUAb2]